MVYALFHAPFHHKFMFFLLMIYIAFIRAEAEPTSNRYTLGISSNIILAACLTISGMGLAYQSITSAANIKSAIISKYQRYENDQQVFKFSSRVNTLPKWFVHWIKDVDYRNKPPKDFTFTALNTHGYQSTLYTIGPSRATQ